MTRRAEVTEVENHGITIPELINIWRMGVSYGLQGEMSQYKTVEQSR